MHRYYLFHYTQHLRALHEYDLFHYAQHLRALHKYDLFHYAQHLRALDKYDLFYYFEQWFHSLVFPTYAGWKKLIKTKIYENEKRQWAQYCHDHPVCNLPKSVWKLLTGIAAGQSQAIIPISLVVCTYRLF